jgi:hypothetical protein
VKILIALLLLLPIVTTAQSNYNEAANYFGQALVIQTGADKKIEALIRQKASKEVIQVAEQIGPLSRIIIEQKVELEWTW